jgi:hypothetical protein
MPEGTITQIPPQSWVYDSVADRVLRSACVPVLMVRAPGCTPGM